MKYLFTLLKGMGMGAADVVPGVSGGTIAFITGIYEELINSIKSINLTNLALLLRGQIRAFWTGINGNFLLALFAGIIISVLSLVRLIHYLLHAYPVLLWAFFFGLILASALVVGRKVNRWNLGSIGLLLAGIAIAVYITLATPAETPEALWFIFLSGAIAICAMILPGISGSFLLLLMRKYEFIVTALKDMDVVVIATFLAGCVTGLLSFSHVLSFMFRRFHNQTIALLTGFMVGSLSLVWPWKNVIETRINSKGEEVPFRFESVLPAQFEGEPYLAGTIALALGSFALIYLIERLANKGKEV